MTAILRFVFITLWIVVVVGALYLYFFRRDLVQRELEDALSVTSIAAAVVYLFLGSIRAFTLIPATFLVLAALPFFAPVPLFLLSLAGILISSASIYLFSEALHLDELFERKHKHRVEKMKAVLQRNQVPIIIAWSFFPLTPTDLICYVCGVLKVNFKKFLLAVSIGEGTICAIYIFFGDYLKRMLPYGL
jgi:uncharacterized membrane protein YdjX (TVP38/TMEM64 family)